MPLYRTPEPGRPRGETRVTLDWGTDEETGLQRA